MTGIGEDYSHFALAVSSAKVGCSCQKNHSLDSPCPQIEKTEKIEKIEKTRADSQLELGFQQTDLASSPMKTA